jgi:hypothetical protein
MTILEQGSHMPDEEVLPLMQRLQLDSSSSSSRPGRQQQHKQPLRRRIRLQMQRVTPELVAIALGELAGVAWCKCSEAGLAYSEAMADVLQGVLVADVLVKGMVW